MPSNLGDKPLIYFDLCISKEKSKYAAKTRDIKESVKSHCSQGANPISVQV